MAFYKKTKKQSLLKSELVEDSAYTISSERMLGSWLDQIYSDFEKNGGLEDLPGKGKPLDIKSGDPLMSVLSNANVLPVWLTLQHEIRDAIQVLIKRMDAAPAMDSELEVTEINKKIKKYNTLVPTPILQKGVLSKGSILQQSARWE